MQKKHHFRWYMHHTQSKGSGSREIVHPNLPNKIGTVVVHDWPVHDGPNHNSKVIAHAQGLHIQAGMGTHQNWHWHNSFSIVFEDCSCYKGSTLQVMGMVVTGGEWAIVGGTGEFSMAQGVIRKKLHEERCDGNIVELDIQFFYTPIEW